MMAGRVFTSGSADRTRHRGGCGPLPLQVTRLPGFWSACADRRPKRSLHGQLQQGQPQMILIIDNYDSFTYNLVQCIGEIDHALDIQVFRNDRITTDEIAALRPSHLIISPGPCTPREAGISVGCVERFMGEVPILGVCLGHQSIGQATGSDIVRAKELMHGKTDAIHHDNRGLFAGLPNPFIAARYHSLVIREGTVSDDFEVGAWAFTRSGQREIMGVRHRRFPVEGWQFHPESFLTDCGHELLRRFLRQSVAS